MERMIVIVAVVGVVTLIVRDGVDLYNSRERGVVDEPLVEPQFRHFQPQSETVGMDYLKLALAYLVDLAPFGLLLLILHHLFVPLDHIGSAKMEAGPQGMNSVFDAMIALMAMLLAFALARALHILVVAKTQRSLGLYLAGYQVSDEDGSAPRMWDYVARSLDNSPLTELGSRRRSSTRLRYIAKGCKLVKTPA